MSQTPSPETPSRAMVREVAGHPLQRRSIIALLASLGTGLPALLSQLHAIPGLALPHALEMTLAVVSALALWLAQWLGSLDAADQAARAAVRGPGGEQDVLIVPEGRRLS